MVARREHFSNYCNQVGVLIDGLDLRVENFDYLIGITVLHDYMAANLESKSVAVIDSGCELLCSLEAVTSAKESLVALSHCHIVSKLLLISHINDLLDKITVGASD